MTSRERVQMVLAHEEPDVLPANDSLWDETRRRFQAEGMPADIPPADFFNFDIDHLFLDASPRFPERLIEETAETFTYVSKHGYSCKRWKNQSGALHYFDHRSRDPSGWKEIKQRMIVDVDGTARISKSSYFEPFIPYPTWEGSAAQFRALQAAGRFILLLLYGPFEATWRHHGYVESNTDLLDNPDWMEEMFATYADLACATIHRGLQHGIRPDGIFLLEDLGTTHGPLMSPQAFRTRIKPFYAQIFEMAKTQGMAVFLHSDGRIMALLDDLMDVGVQALNPIDLAAGMDPRELKQRYGKRLTLYGGISARDMHDAVKSNAEIDRNIPLLAKGGGYIFHSDHSVPPTVSLDRYQKILKRVRSVAFRRQSMP